jgi:peptide-methionine (R)-S-oxide reductase
MTLISRRHFALLATTAFVAAACSARSATRESKPGSTLFANDPSRALSEADWKAKLSPEAFDVLRKEGTEPAFTSPLNDEKRDGVFHCAGCDLALFSSNTKYDSGTGWPSFWDALPGALETSVDYKLVYARTEYHCARCLGHQGHVFDDGPSPTGLRYCNNGVALIFRQLPT